MTIITIHIDPRPQSRPRFGKGKVYELPALRRYKEQVKAAGLSTAGLKPLTGAVRCSLRFYRKFKATSRRFGDFDNLAKAAIDALNGIAFVDDSQIVSCNVEKIQSQNPRVEVEIEDFPQEFLAP